MQTSRHNPFSWRARVQHDRHNEILRIYMYIRREKFDLVKYAFMICDLFNKNRIRAFIYVFHRSLKLQN